MIQAILEAFYTLMQDRMNPDKGSARVIEIDGQRWYLQYDNGFITASTSDGEERVFTVTVDLHETDA